MIETRHIEKNDYPGILVVIETLPEWFVFGDIADYVAAEKKHCEKTWNILFVWIFSIITGIFMTELLFHNWIADKQAVKGFYYEPCKRRSKKVA